MQSVRVDNKQILPFSISPTLTQNIRVIFHETYHSGPEPNITKKRILDDILSYHDKCMHFIDIGEGWMLWKDAFFALPKHKFL